MSDTPPRLPPPGGLSDAELMAALDADPAFFVRQAAWLARLRLPQTDARVVSLQERRLDLLRQRAENAEGLHLTMIQHGRENTRIAQRLHRCACALLGTGNLAQRPQALLEALLREFDVPQRAVRLWGLAAPFQPFPYAQPVGQDVQHFAASLVQPYCGMNGGFAAVQWLEVPSRVLSLALVPLRRPDDGGCFGLLVLGSHDPRRYTVDMGTDFLSQLGELASAALAPLQDAP